MARHREDIQMAAVLREKALRYDREGGGERETHCVYKGDQRKRIGKSGLEKR